MEETVFCRQVSVRGVVQGVGFRPFVYRLAHEHHLTGWVLNHSGGVEIEVEGTAAALDAFLRDLTAKAPPLARIVSVEASDAPRQGYERFDIRHSVAEEGRYQLISPDIATCADCLRELLDPADRRYRYPFTNCTNCGPRFTIIRDIPYDRPLTTMAPFPMCPDCQREYDDPLDRRFHAQPNACPVCGPQVWLEKVGQVSNLPGQDVIHQAARPVGPVSNLPNQDVIHQAARLLREGAILAIKGLGGFHLACDATNAQAVQTLRQRKGRPAKPLAVMMATLDDVRRHCRVGEAEAALLTGRQAPIVLLRWREESSIARQVAPGNLYLGVMLPYTPLHHILLRDVGRPLVMTSGNLSEEPIAQTNDEARRRLSALADAFLLHNRRIHARCDDSVVFFNDQSPTSRFPNFVRRSRGYAPFPIRLPFRVGQILAVGAELKNTVCLTRDDFAFLSQHIGDMENLETLEHFEQSIAHLQHLFRIEPERIAHDLHPDYASTKWAGKWANGEMGKWANGQMGNSQFTNPQFTNSPIPNIPIQHHHAHIAACLADNGWTSDSGPVIGVAWDGTGLGLDGRIWGGEWFVGDYRGFERVAHLESLPMPGGDAAVRNPWRLAVGYLHALGGEPPTLPGVSEQEQRIVRQQVERGLNAPLTSAVGRLFDAVAALIGLRLRVSYEAQAAIELEMAATRWGERAGGRLPAPYPFAVEPVEAQRRPVGQVSTLPNLSEAGVVRLGPLLAAIQADLAAGVDRGEIAWRFHKTMSALLVAVCRQIAAGGGPRTVALSGGVFQNRLLLALAVPALEQAGFRVLLHRQVPCNDGGLSLGQAVLAHFIQS